MQSDNTYMYYLYLTSAGFYLIIIIIIVYYTKMAADTNMYIKYDNIFS